MMGLAFALTRSHAVLGMCELAVAAQNYGITVTLHLLTPRGKDERFRPWRDWHDISYPVSAVSIKCSVTVIAP